MSENYQYDFCVYGMPVHKIEHSIYGGLFGNATRAVGLANNLAHNGFRTALIVEDNFIYENSPFLSKNLNFIKKKYDLAKQIKSAKFLLISCTNLSSFRNVFGEDPLIEHNNKFYICCFDNGQTICTKNLSKGAIGISFNNLLQKKMWDKRNSLIPSYVIPYGVNEFPYVENAIKSSETNRAIWIGEFRRNDMVERLVQFANVNPDCKVDVVTRKIFDQNTINGYGSFNEPYADFTNGDTPSKFYNIFYDIAGFCPKNIEYLGILEGENHVVLGSHSIGIDFSRFPQQQHDNTKILDYLRSGLAVICDRGTPSYRFVEEAEFGVVVSPNCSAKELRDAYKKCEQLIKNKNRQEVALYFRDKYGWPSITNQVIKALNKAQQPKNVYFNLKRQITILFGKKQKKSL